MEVISNLNLINLLKVCFIYQLIMNWLLIKTLKLLLPIKLKMEEVKIYLLLHKKTHSICIKCL